MAEIVDMSGLVVGPWRVIERGTRPVGSREAGAFWLCECHCPRKTREVLPGARLRAGRAQRGCYHCRKPFGSYKGTGAYDSWRGMIDRCLNPRHNSFHRYGGRGITVCDRWRDGYEAFRADMGERPKAMTLDRIDRNGNYEPGNCRWADTKTQARNSDNFKLTDEQVAAILRLLDSGAKQVDVAEACGVSRSHIANIAIGNSRKAA